VRWTLPDGDLLLLVAVRPSSWVTPDSAKAIADAGGWAAFIFLCGLLGVGYVRQWFVPGWIYRELQARYDTLIGQLDRNTDSAKVLNAGQKTLADGLARLRSDVMRRDRAGKPDAGA
jgi:hypothetical protein